MYKNERQLLKVITNKIPVKINIILLIIIFYIIISLNKKKIHEMIKSKQEVKISHKLTKKKPTNNNINNIKELIHKLNINRDFRKPKYILLFDYFVNEYCNDINSYIIFKYYLSKNISYAFYIINNQSHLYKTLLKENKTQNLIPINPKKNIWNILYPYLLNSKILVHSYVFNNFNQIIDKVSYLKYIKINHGVRFFKKKIGKYELKDININKYNSIVTSPLEYDLYKNTYNLTKENLYKAGLPRYDRFINIKLNKSENKCILIAFTYRKYNNNLYVNSLFKKNLERLFSDESLILFLKTKKIDLVYIPHHFDTYRKRPFNKTKFSYIKYKDQNFLSYYIEQCSLCVTDFSSISFDFMFQNKPTLFYLIDYNDSHNFHEKIYMNYDLNKDVYFGNVFYDQESLIKKIKYFINRKFKIDEKLKKHYESLFYFKKNITERIINIIDYIIRKK